MISVTFYGSLTQELAWLTLFGDVSIIALGDLFQLEPVMDGYVFKDIKTQNTQLWGMWVSFFHFLN